MKLRILSVVVATMLGFAPALADMPAFMTIEGATTQPIGQYEMCQAHPTECRGTRRADPVMLTDAAWQQLVAVNATVNGAVAASTDQAIYGRPEVWAYPTTVGDCEDFVLLKRRMLAEAGWPLSDLLITMVYQSTGEAHAVLTVRTSAGDYVLDNLTDAVRLWGDTGYLFVKRQSERNSGDWVAIGLPPVQAVARVPAPAGMEMLPTGPIGP